MYKEIANATIETVYMILCSGLLTIVFGGALGISLYEIRKQSGKVASVIYTLLSALVNMTRSFPFIILMIAITPFTKLVVGTSIGNNAAIVALTVSAIPFFARLTESSLNEVGAGLDDLSVTLGATGYQKMKYIMIPEALPSLISGITLTLINLVGYTAMAGAIGGGGLGTLAINYGHQRFNLEVMISTVVILILLVQLIQFSGDRIYRRLNHAQ